RSPSCSTLFSLHDALPILSVKDAQELVALQAALLQPTAEKAAAYSRHLYDIAAATSAEVNKVAEETAAEAQQKFSAVIDTAVKKDRKSTRLNSSHVKISYA